MVLRQVPRRLQFIQEAKVAQTKCPLLLVCFKSPGHAPDVSDEMVLSSLQPETNYKMQLDVLAA
jgi:hypothetical protein